MSTSSLSIFIKEQKQNNKISKQTKAHSLPIQTMNTPSSAKRWRRKRRRRRRRQRRRRGCASTILRHFFDSSRRPWRTMRETSSRETEPAITRNSTSCYQSLKCHDANRRRLTWHRIFHFKITPDRHLRHPRNISTIFLIHRNIRHPILLRKTSRKIAKLKA